MGKVRESDIELFRIVATFMIIIVHCNGWFLRLNGVDSWYVGGGCYAIVRTLVQSITCIGVDCFILISGYFSIKPKLHSLVNLFSLLLFFYVGGYLCRIDGFENFSWKQLFCEARAFSRENWFIQSYLFLVLMSPTLNSFVESITKKQFQKYLAVFIFCAFYFGCVLDSKYFSFNQGYSATTFFLIYLIGRYLKFFGESDIKKISTSLLFFIWLAVTVLMTIIRLIEFQKEEIYLSYCSPLLLLSSSILFLFFRRLNIQSKIINDIASSCLAVFILHTCTPLMQLIMQKDYYFFTHGSMGMWMCKTLLWCMLIFIIAIILDKCRLFIFNPIVNLTRRIEM